MRRYVLAVVMVAASLMVAAPVSASNEATPVVDCEQPTTVHSPRRCVAEPWYAPNYPFGKDCPAGKRWVIKQRIRAYGPDDGAKIFITERQLTAQAEDIPIQEKTKTNDFFVDANDGWVWVLTLKLPQGAPLMHFRTRHEALSWESFGPVDGVQQKATANCQW